MDQGAPSSGAVRDALLAISDRLNPKLSYTFANRASAKEHIGDLNGAYRDAVEGLAIKPNEESAKDVSDRVRVALGRGGEARAAAFAELALSLVRDDAPVAVLWRANFPVVSTSRIDGMFAQPLYGLDLAALRRAA